MGLSRAALINRNELAKPKCQLARCPFFFPLQVSRAGAAEAWVAEVGFDQGDTGSVISASWVACQSSFVITVPSGSCNSRIGLASAPFTSSCVSEGPIPRTKTWIGTEP
jgi:hypothetical protein